VLALVFEGGKARVREVPRPRIRNGFALVRVIASGICNTDLELMRGYHGFSGIPGHEFVGVVEGPVSSSWIGKRVVGEINLACGNCGMCCRMFAMQRLWTPRLLRKPLRPLLRNPDRIVGVQVSVPL